MNPTEEQKSQEIIDVLIARAKQCTEPRHIKAVRDMLDEFRVMRSMYGDKEANTWYFSHLILLLK